MLTIFLKKPFGLASLLFLLCSSYWLSDFTTAVLVTLFLPAVVTAFYTIVLYKKKFSSSFKIEVALWWPLLVLLYDQIVCNKISDQFIALNAIMPTTSINIVIIAYLGMLLLCLCIIALLHYCTLSVGNSIGLWQLSQQPKKVESNLYDYDSVLARIPEVEPPWIKYPNCNPPSWFSWGVIDEDWYKKVWAPYWNGLSYKQQDQYIKKWNIPFNWHYYFFIASIGDEAVSIFT